MVAMGKGATHGVLFRDAEALEGLCAVDTVVFDKTGTLTEGAPRLVSVETAPGVDEAALLRVAASLESGSEHPLGAAIVAGARSRGLDLTVPDAFEAHPGEGICGRVDGKPVRIGRREFLAAEGAPMDALVARAAALRGEARSVVFVAVDGVPWGLLAVADPVKESARDTLAALRRDGVELVMLTGDHPDTAAQVAAPLGIETVHAGVLPTDKARIVAELQHEGRVVAMAGDGINDAPALAQAEVGLAMGTGTDVAIQSAGITLLGGDLGGVVRARRISNAALRNIRQNLWFAFAYNALGVPIAAGALYPSFGLLLSPMIAAAAMSLSSISVIGNALRLRRLSL